MHLRCEETKRTFGRFSLLVFRWFCIAFTEGKLTWNEIVKTDENFQTTFYITDSSAYRNRLLYFRHDDWNVLCAPLIERLTTETFEKLEEVSC